MLTTINKFIQGIFATTYEKDGLQKELLITRSLLTDIVIPSLDLASKLASKKGVEKHNGEKLTKMFKNIGLRNNHDIPSAISSLASFAKEMEEAIPILEKVLDGSMEDFITDKTMTAKQAGVIGTISNISSAAGYMSDLTMYITYGLSKDIDFEKGFILKRVFKDTTKFKNVFSIYNTKIRNILKDMDGLTEVKIWDVPNFKLTAGFKDKKFRLPVNNFALNPIYHIRKLIVDAEVQYYDYLKYKRELIELKLKEKELEEPSPSLEKQIKYYEEKLASIEYKIKKIEESVDD